MPDLDCVHPLVNRASLIWINFNLVPYCLLKTSRQKKWSFVLLQLRRILASFQAEKNTFNEKSMYSLRIAHSYSADVLDLQKFN